MAVTFKGDNDPNFMQSRAKETGNAKKQDAKENKGYGGKQKMPNGNNKYWKAMFAEAMRKLGIKERSDSWEECHHLINRMGLQKLDDVVDYLKSLGYGNGNK